MPSLGDDAVELEVAGGRRGFMLAADAADAAALDAPAGARLLPAFDPSVVGSVRTDTDVLATEHRARVHRPQGWISPVLLVGGRMAGVWRHERRSGRLVVEVEPFAPLDDAARIGAETEAARLAAFLGGGELELRWAG